MDQNGPRVSTSGLATDLTLTRSPDIARNYQKDLSFLSWYNHVIGYNICSETILIVFVMDQDGPRRSTSGLPHDLILTSCQDVARDYPKT